jgi:hypothetical protein
MKRAAERFALEARSSRSPLVEETWQTRSKPEGSFSCGNGTCEYQGARSDTKHQMMRVSWPFQYSSLSRRL